MITKFAIMAKSKGSRVGSGKGERTDHGAINDREGSSRVVR